MDFWNFITNRFHIQLYTRNPGLYIIKRLRTPKMNHYGQLLLFIYNIVFRNHILQLVNITFLINYIPLHKI